MFTVAIATTMLTNNGMEASRVSRPRTIRAPPISSV
jgi:hypothetical protein